ncbi:hypothetical protein [Larkinella punicea]|nr:hypothetical protein [Larkinella punicea]
MSNLYRRYAVTPLAGQQSGLLHYLYPGFWINVGFPLMVLMSI